MIKDLYPCFMTLSKIGRRASNSMLNIIIFTPGGREGSAGAIPPVVYPNSITKSVDRARFKTMIKDLLNTVYTA